MADQPYNARIALQECPAHGRARHLNGRCYRCMGSGRNRSRPPKSEAAREREENAPDYTADELRELVANSMYEFGPVVIRRLARQCLRLMAKLQRAQTMCCRGEGMCIADQTAEQKENDRLTSPSGAADGWPGEDGADAAEKENA
jgi:hypothetical protein